MKKRLLILGLGLAVVGTGMVINKLRKRNNEEVNEVEETIETNEIAIDEEVNEEETVIVDEEDVEVIDCEKDEFEQRCWFRRKIVRPILIVATFVTLTIYKNYKVIKNEIINTNKVNKERENIADRFRQIFYSTMNNK